MALWRHHWNYMIVGKVIRSQANQFDAGIGIVRIKVTSFSMFGTLLIGLFVALIIWDHLNKRHRKAVLKKSQIPGRFALPLIGNALSMRGLNSENIIDLMRTSVREQGKILHSWVLHQLSIFDADPKDLEELLSSPVHITKNNVYDMLALWLGDGLLMSTGKKWHTRRKIITPTFHFKILEEFLDIFDQQSSHMVDTLRKKADGRTVVDMFPVVCLTALDIIAETAMGVKVNAQMNPQFSYVKAVKTVTSIIAQRLRRPLWRVDWMFRLTAPKHYNNMMENIATMKAFTNDVIQKRRQTLEQNLQKQNHAATQEDDIGCKKRMALLDVLLQANVDGKPLSNEDIREEVETFMFEGHDTTTSAISFALYLISRHAEVQQRLFAEIREVIGDDRSQAVTHRQLQDLKYMECVIKESMRLYPPVPIIGRYFSEDTMLNGKVIPANSHLNMPLFVVLRDPEYFQDADDFKPERFFSENLEAAPIFPFAYVPFSAGPRNCIGQKYAMLEMKSTISKMLRHYELVLAGPEVIPSLSLIMRSMNGMNMALRPRL